MATKRADAYLNKKMRQTRKAAEKKGFKVPDKMIPTPYEGYFWCPKEECLYSCKLVGQFIPLKKQESVEYMKRLLPYMNCDKFYFNISGSHRTILTDNGLQKITACYKKEI